MVAINFDANSVEAAEDLFEPLAAGWYKVIITKTEMKPTSAGNGYRLNFSFKVIEGEQANKAIFVSVNWQNPNEDATRIGRSKVSAIAKALGILNIADTAQLHDQPFWLKVSYEEANGKYPAQNDIKAAKNVNDAPNAGGYAAPAAPSVPAPITGGYPNTAQAPAAPQQVPYNTAPAPQSAPPTWNNNQSPAQPWDQQVPQQPPVQQAPAQRQAPQAAPRQGEKLPWM